MRIPFVRLASGALACVPLWLSHAAYADPVAANTNTPLSLTPPMGFNDWARFQCVPQAPLDGSARAGYSFQRFMLDQAEAMRGTGLVSAGYTMLMVDDCWMMRNGAGQIQGATRWGGSQQPGFDPDLGAYATSVHGAGMLVGLYNTSGAKTCQGVAAGEQGYQQQDAQTYAAWGVDALKLDNCGATGNATPQQLFKQMADALGQATAGSPRKILFDESAPAGYGPGGPSKYATLAWVRPLGQMWRTGPDIKTTSVDANGRPVGDPWDYYNADAYQEGVYQSYNDTIALSRYVSPGNWNDPDQLLIGDNGLTPAEERSQMALWSALAAPLIISADTRKIAANPQDAHLKQSLATLTNAEVIAVDQDALGIGGYRVSRDDPSTSAGIDVVAKPLADGGLAVVVLNKGSTSVDYTLPFANLGYKTGVGGSPCTLAVRDLWAHSTSSATSRLQVSIGAHDNAMVKLSGTCGGWTPTGEIEATQTDWGATPLCMNANQATAGAAVTLAACSAAPAQRWSRNTDGTVQLAGTGLCLSSTAPDSTGAVNGASGQWATLAACSAQDKKQRFAYKLAGQLVAAADGRCVDVYQGAVGAVGTPVDLYSCGVNQSNQLWAAPHLAAPAS
ncbi:alpha-galactosidase [Burkholderia sp. FERM BP-3421]|uniref:alpha-galactosidase n=1 Tax=Burkholderia sp. FERM BP-3421 TaxID=1494466 RepID=UPI00235DC8C5|nr:alpha-galactosidase [Burkholderia sp. FERM BP-3421]WDD92346.1 alpha-galactosidase [Burkholderia sp. FERM BP-3421]